MGRRESGLQHIVKRGVLFGLGTTIIVMNFAWRKNFKEFDCRLTVDSEVSFIRFFPVGWTLPKILIWEECGLLADVTPRGISFILLLLNYGLLGAKVTMRWYPTQVFKTWILHF